MRFEGYRMRKAPVVGSILVSLALLVGGCGLDDVEQQRLEGPSDLGMSIQLQAFPDVVNADGVSRAVVELILRDQNGAPIVGKAVEFGFSGDGRLYPSADSTFVGPIQSSLIMATGQNGVARVVYVAGRSVGMVVTIYVRPYGIDSNRGFYRLIEIYQQ
jgi:hypothetical protein